MTPRFWSNTMCASSGPSGVFLMNCFTKHADWVPTLMYPVLATIAWTFLLVSTIMFVISTIKYRREFEERLNKSEERLNDELAPKKSS